jgi:hypothetical protein
MKQKPYVKCEKCNGTGVGKLSEELAALLDSIPLKGFTARTAQKKLDPDKRVVPTAWNNRLRHLYNLGLAVRQRRGKEWFFFKA